MHVFDRSLIRGVDFARIVPTLPQCAQRLVGNVLDQFQKPGVRAEYVLANVRAGFDDEFLHLAVHHFTQAFHEQALGVALEQRVPVGFPAIL